MDNIDIIEQLAAKAREESAPATQVRDVVMRRLQYQSASTAKPWSLFAGVSAAAAIIVLGLAMLATSSQASASSELFPNVESVTPW